MTIPAKDIIRRVVETLQDPTSIRWPVSELVRYFNDAQREVVMYRPDAFVITEPVALTPGARQSLPALGTKLVDIARNSAGTRRAVRITNREILDAQLPGWNGQPGTTEILHFMYDPREPRTFHVYPPAAAGASLEVTYASMPADLAEPADGVLYTAVTGNLGLPDIYANAVQDHILFRAYSKDAEYAGNAARAQSHYALFTTALGVEVKATVAIAPNPTGNPNRAPAGAA